MRDLLRLIALYRPHLKWIALSTAVAAAATLANVTLMATSGWFITAMAAAGLAGVSMNYFTPAALIRALAIIRTAGRYGERLLSHEATLRLVASIRAHLFSALVPLAPGGLDDLSSGDLLSRLKTDIDRLELVFLRLISPLVVALLTLFVVGLVLFIQNGWLAGSVLAVLIVTGLLLPALAAALSAAPSRALTAVSADLRRLIVDDLSGLTVLSATGAFARHRDRLVAAMAASIAVERTLANRAAVGQMFGRLGGDLALTTALLIGVPLVAAGRMAGPNLAMAALLSLSAAEAFMGLPAAFLGLNATLASARRVFALIDRPVPVADPAAPEPLPAGRDLVIDAVTVRYRAGARPALDGVSLAIPAGTHLALVGDSGAGKSSLAALLIRARDPAAGTVRLSGVPLPALELFALRRAILLVPQKPHLFTATLDANLRVARPDASPQALADAIDIAGLGDLVARLPEGLNTPVGVAGSTLSGGEARRVAIARALLADPDILILDEPGEGLDGETEARVLDRLLDRRAGRTVIVITHAAVALRRMHRIIRLEDGRLAGTDSVPSVV